MERIKVLHLIPMLGPGGAERVVVQIARGLNPQRFETGVVSLWHRVGSDLEQMLDDSEVRTWYLGKGPGFDGRIYRRLHRILREYAPDIVHTHLHVLRYALPSLMLLQRSSCVHTVHNRAEREVEPRARLLQRYALAKLSTPVAVSTDVKNSLQERYRLPSCAIIPNGIPTANYASPSISRGQWRARAGFSEDQVLFVCVARLAPQKNHALLLEAFAQGPGRDPLAHLVLIGDGELRQRLIEQSQNLGLTGKVHFLGVRTDIAEALSAMDVFVLSSDWEGNPLSVMEAMAAGLPIVSTAVGGVPEIVRNEVEGLLVAANQPQALSRALLELLSNPEKRCALGAAARHRANLEFDESRMVRAYERLYEVLLNRACPLKRERPARPQDLWYREA
jgi:glycosyltransferase involved in cell wall biosynthesis